ncbi:MAG: two-component regulator propeller domain-containing protein [Bacteroidota bacterium]
MAWINSGLAADTVYAIAEDPDGSVWLGTHRGLSHLVGTGFDNILTNILVPEVEESNMTAWYNPSTIEIMVRFRVRDPGPVVTELWTVDGKLVIKTSHFYPQEGITVLPISAGQAGSFLSEGIYIVRLNIRGNSESAKILVRPKYRL